MNIENLILGAGMAGISTSYHVGHEKCLLLEKNSHPYGHATSHLRDGYTWDEGPHVSFTTSDYVKNLFAESVKGAYEEFNVKAKNYFYGHWIDHPAQTNLYQVPKPLRTKCLNDFLNSRSQINKNRSQIQNYKEWLIETFGKTFAEAFPSIYTNKYWTVKPELLNTDWIGSKVYYPEVDDVVKGSRSPLDRSTYYIKGVRYPSSGGYQSFCDKIRHGAHIKLNCEVEYIDLKNREVRSRGGERFQYQRLINTMPLPLFVYKCVQSTEEIKGTANALACSQLLLINVSVPHRTQHDGTWFYIYDKEKYATRINCTEMLSPNNAPEGHTGIQVEVYFSQFKPLESRIEDIADKVIEELIEMGFIDLSKISNQSQIDKHTLWIDWANVIFDLNANSNLEKVWSFFENHGLQREEDDVHPLTHWDEKKKKSNKLGNLIFAGRYGQWKYFWTDDCVLRGQYISKNS